MSPINLLPTELTTKSSFIKLSNIFKKISYLGVAIFTISLVAVIGTFIFLSQQIKTTVSKQEQLKEVIGALSQTEQRMILARDRIGKAQQILSIDTAQDEIEALDKLMLNMPEGVYLKDADLSDETIEMEFTVGSSSVFAEFMAKMVALDAFDSIQLTSFRYTNNAAFTAKFKLTI
jgi:hypothetical protein